MLSNVQVAPTELEAVVEVESARLMTIEPSVLPVPHPPPEICSRMLLALLESSEPEEVIAPDEPDEDELEAAKSICAEKSSASEAPIAS